MARILLVEDDPALREGLVELLEREKYVVTSASCIEEARGKLNALMDMVILDVSLPDGNGVSLCRDWRTEGIDLPILFLTAKDEEYDVVRGLDAGGNDYVTKPFRVQELLSRIRALLRRGSASSVIKSDALVLDHARMQVKKDGEILPLTLTEYKLLYTMIQQKGLTTRNILLDILWDDGAKFVDDNTLTVHISRLREKIGANHIKTIRGVGYQWIE